MGDYKLTVEELLKPRVICVGFGEFHYPGSECFVGDILTMTSARSWRDEAGFLVEVRAERYPHLFNSLQWYHHRTKETISLVQYVKWTESSEGIVAKVSKWNYGHLGWECVVFDFPGCWNPAESRLAISSEAEYRKYLKTKPVIL
jgi:hypothetical protein